MASETSTSGRGHSSKRLIVCCDGTWMDSNIGYEKPTLWRPHGKLQVPSNVTRISRCFKRRCADGMLQIIGYESGVGADKEGSNALNTLSGGAFGIGLAERVREAYSYLCANYIDGDEIILVGFSRGAFTARSVAGIIGNLGLLTREGVEHFYPIFKDMQNWMNDSYADPFPDSPFPNKPKGPNAADEYRARLEKLGYTRVYQGSGELIKVKAVCVWDTWHDTSLSNRIEHAFHALALDECRAPFSPAVWERLPEDKRTTDLRQVWFPGNHGNCGGGWEDQGIANCSLAWMMDQMASIGVEFDKKSLDRIFTQSVDYYQNLEETTPGKTLVSPWAIEPIYKNNRPLRPWSLGAIRKTTGLLYWLSGEIRRTPGLYRQIDKPGLDPSKFLQDTNERIHSSVRVRLACKGLGLNDRGIWACEPLKNWTLKRTKAEFDDPIARHPSWGLGEENQVDQPGLPGSERYVWEYSGPEEEAPTDPRQRVMVEDKMGPYERYLLRVTGGKPNVYEFADSGYVD